MNTLLNKIDPPGPGSGDQKGECGRLITHRVPLEDAPATYRIFRDKKDAAVKFVLTPGAPRVLQDED